MHRLVLDALAPSRTPTWIAGDIYTAALYSPTERDKWAAHELNDSVASASFSYCSPLRHTTTPRPRERCSTPNHRLQLAPEAYQDRSVPLQVSVDYLLLQPTAAHDHAAAARALLHAQPPPAARTRSVSGPLRAATG
ncbi:uncharacterized protein LOC134795124 [Cydia splendana]|uniref:uncharacterized protein LOC134795124 n=1 Tax=Cydia splendana TaxID=1100963 RepID=UPI00300C2D80